MRSTLAFDPNESPYFNYWRNVTRLSFSDIRFTHTFYLPEDSASSYHQFVAYTRIEDISLTSTTKFTDCDFTFDNQEFRARWSWTDCDLSLDARLSIACEGFDELSVTVRDIPILSTEWDGFGITLRLETTFTTTTKTVEPTFTCRSDWIDCLKILCEVVISDDNAASIEGISFYGIRLKTTFPEGIKLQMDTSFVEDKNSSVTGYSDYFERWMLSGPTIPCCGSPGRWQIDTYFQSSESTLFGWGMSNFEVKIYFIDQIRLSTKLTFRAEAPHWEWTLGWRLSW